MKDYLNWVHLNEAGRAWIGNDIFPDGIVPVRSMLHTNATLEGLEGTQKVYLIEWRDLDQEQKDKLLVKIGQRNPGATLEVIKTAIEKDGFLPLRGELVCGSGSRQVGLFL
jgi:glycerol-3-phosphate responsive antiterminator